MAMVTVQGTIIIVLMDTDLEHLSLEVEREAGVETEEPEVETGEAGVEIEEAGVETGEPSLGGTGAVKSPE